MNRARTNLNGVRRLAWKEWRETQMVPMWTAVLLGMAIVALRMFDVLKDYQESTGTLIAILVTAWCTAAIFCASGLISREVGNGTLQFLMAQPISRRSVWWTKCAVGLSALLASIVTSTLVWAAVQRIIFGADAFSWVALRPIGASAVMLLGSSVPWLIGALGCFTVSLAVSTLVDRSISAATLAVAAGIGLLMCMDLLTMFYAWPGGRSNTTSDISIMMAVIAPSFLAASGLAFCRGESLRTRRRFLWAGAGLAVGLAATIIPVLCGLGWMTRFQRSGSYIVQRSLSPDGRLLALAVGSGPVDGRVLVGSSATFRAAHLVIERADGEGTPRVLPGGSFLAWSPDGRYLLFRQSRGFLGLCYGYGRQRLIIVDTQTGGQRELAGDMLRYADSGGGQAVWSPDGRWLALRCWSYGYSRVALFDCTNSSRSLQDSYMVVDNSVGTPLAEKFPQQSLEITGPGDYSVGLDDEDSRERSLGWSIDSKYLYLAQPGGGETAKLVAVDVAMVQARLRGSVQRTNTALPSAQAVTLDTKDCMLPGCATLCVSSANQEMQLSLSDDPHRALVTVGAVGRPKATSYPIDLDAATRSAQKEWEGLRDRADRRRRKDGNRTPVLPVPHASAGLASPDAITWARRFSLRDAAGRSHTAIPPAVSSGPALSPDGRWLVLPRSGLTALDLEHPSRMVSLPQPGPGHEVRWLPHGHELLQWKDDKELWITDVSLSATHRIPLDGQTVIGVSGDRRLLLINLPSGRDARPLRNGPLPDAFHPITRSIPIDAVGAPPNGGIRK